MLEFVLGRAGSGKSETLRRMLFEESRGDWKKLVLIVPEQYSFEAERKMLALGGARLMESVQVLSFTRLCEVVFRTVGGAAGRRLSEGGRRILMAMAISSCEDELEVYRSSAKRGRVSDIMLTAVNEMKMCGLSPGDLSSVSQRLSGSLKEKLREIGLIYGTYNALVETSYLDSRDDLTRLKEALKESDFFSGALVAVDSFEGFTAQEMGVLREIMKKAGKVVVSLCTDGSDTGLFSLVTRTRGRLMSVAREDNVPIGETKILTDSPRYKNESLKHLEANLFSDSVPCEKCDGILIYEARDAFDEAEFVSAEICRLTREKGYRYRDIAVICRNAEAYSGSLDVAFKKRGIPCFVSRPQPIDGEPVPRLIESAFDAIRTGFSTDSLLTLMKSGVAGFSDEEISTLENYAYVWNLSGENWRMEFTRHPGGFDKEWTEEDREELNTLNACRERLIKPLLGFASSTRSAGGREITEAVYKLLIDLDVPEHVLQNCAELRAAGEESLAGRQLRVWEKLMELLEQFHELLGDAKMERERYAGLFREVLKGEDVSEIPQTTDEVIFGDVQQVRQSSPRAVFLIGVCAGDFPMTPINSGVFSDVERRELISQDLPLGDPLELRAAEERFLAYSAACVSSEMLIISYPKVSGTEEKEESELVAAVKEIFPTIQPLKDLPDEFFSNSPDSAFSRMAMRFSENSPKSGAYIKLFEDDPTYAGKLSALRRAAAGETPRLKDREVIDKLYGKNLFLSPTQVEAYYNCPFKYFCKYGLNVQERRRAEVDALAYGNLMHYLFERYFSTPRAKRGNDLKELVERLVRRYADEKLGGYENLSGREKYRLERLSRSAVTLISHVEEELRQSRFSPEFFELRLDRNSPFPPLKIEMDDGCTVTVGGTIDRADTYTAENGEEYVRVVDYKTGKKEFKLVDVLYGLNMQMLIYLAALTEKGKMLPAGILYMPAAEPSLTGERGEKREKILEDADRELKMKGLVLNNEEIIRAMEAAAKGRFIPATLNNDGSLSKNSSALREDGMRAVMEYAKRLVATMGIKLKDGVAETKPNMINQNACKYCPYKTVCEMEMGDRDVLSDRRDNGEILELMRGESGGSENG